MCSVVPNVCCVKRVTAMTAANKSSLNLKNFTSMFSCRHHSPILTTIFPGGPWLAGTRNVSIPDFIGAMEVVVVVVTTGATRRAKFQSDLRSTPPTNQHPVFYRPDALPVAQPTVSKH